MPASTKSCQSCGYWGGARSSAPGVLRWMTDSRPDSNSLHDADEPSARTPRTTTAKLLSAPPKTML